MIRRPPRSTLFPTRRSSDLEDAAGLGLRLDAMLQNAVQDGKREGCGLAGAGLRDADDVTAGKRKGNSVDLRSEEHTSELQSHLNLVCRLLLEKKKKSLPLHL